MLNNKNYDLVFFDRETRYKLGKTEYVITSHYDSNSELLPAKIKRLLKSEIKNRHQNKIMDSSATA